jgi:hypothetical protein
VAALVAAGLASYIPVSAVDQVLEDRVNSAVNDGFQPSARRAHAGRHRPGSGGPRLPKSLADAQVSGLTVVAMRNSSPPMRAFRAPTATGYAGVDRGTPCATEEAT